MITDDDIAAALRAVQAPQTMQLPPAERLVAVAGRHRNRRRVAATSLAMTAIAGAALSISLAVGHTSHNDRASLIPAAPPATSTTPAPSAKPSAKQPGEDVVTPLSEPVTATGTGGTTTIELGPRPPSANTVEIRLTCLSSGTFNFSGGGLALCSVSDGPGDPTTMTPQALQLPLSPGQTTLTITASYDARWRLTTRYVRAVPSAWSVNASGQTFGVMNANGLPDLVAVQATNGREGYVYAQQRFPELASSPPKGTSGQDQQDQTRSVPVYLSDGKTRIGNFVD